MSDISEAHPIQGREAAASAGLRYASSDTPGIRRRRTGKGFAFQAPDGRRVTDPAVLDRIRALVIPPAWTSVWICPDPDGHIQAIGEDDKGRRQYRYHPKFREVRDGAKFEHMLAFAEALPALRARVAADMAKPGFGRLKVLATVVWLLETTMIRVGNEAYARQNKSYGLTTLHNRHVEVQGAVLKFHFKGKSGKAWRLDLHDRRVARIVRGCQEIPGQHLFQYLDDEGRHQAVTSHDVNAYLREVSGADITAKDFRTWTGTVLAAMALSGLDPADSQARAKQNVAQAIAGVAAALGNTPTICRKCYVHPEIVGAYLDGDLALRARGDIDPRPGGELRALHPDEAAVLAFLQARAGRDLKARKPGRKRTAVRAKPLRRRTAPSAARAAISGSNDDRRALR